MQVGPLAGGLLELNRARGRAREARPVEQRIAVRAPPLDTGTVPLRGGPGDPAAGSLAVVALPVGT